MKTLQRLLSTIPKQFSWIPKIMSTTLIEGEFVMTCGMNIVVIIRYVER
jgi:hypothetical protein